MTPFRSPQALSGARGHYSGPSCPETRRISIAPPGPLAQVVEGASETPVRNPIRRGNGAPWVRIETWSME